MNKVESKNNLTMVHFAFDAPKHITSFAEQRTNRKILDPSSFLRVNRYPVPDFFPYRTNPKEKELSI